jgi:hypothetical protein
VLTHGGQPPPEVGPGATCSWLFIELHLRQGGIASQGLGREEVDDVLGQVGGTLRRIES